MLHEYRRALSASTEFGKMKGIDELDSTDEVEPRLERQPCFKWWPNAPNKPPTCLKKHWFQREVLRSICLQILI